MYTNEEKTTLLHMQQDLILRLQAVSVLLDEHVHRPKQATMELTRTVGTSKKTKPAEVRTLVSGIASTAQTRQAETTKGWPAATKQRMAKYRAEGNDVFKQMFAKFKAGPASGTTLSDLLDACKVSGKFRRRSHANRFHLRITKGWTDDKGVHHPPAATQAPAKPGSTRAARLYKLK